MTGRNNGISWTKYWGVWSIVIILLSNSLYVDASKTNKNRNRVSSSGGRVQKPGQQQQPDFNAASLSYHPSDFSSQQRPRVPPPQQNRPVQSAPPPAPAPAANSPPYPVQQQHQPSAPALPQNNDKKPIGWDVDQHQQKTISSNNNAPPAYSGGSNYQGHPPPYSPSVQNGPPPPYSPSVQGGPPPPYSPQGNTPIHPNNNNKIMAFKKKKKKLYFINDT